MPAGDPAGYLPNVVKSRKSKGQPAYQPRKSRLPKGESVAEAKAAAYKTRAARAKAARSYGTG